MPTTATNTFTLDKLRPYYDPSGAHEIAINLPNSISYVKGQVLGELIGNNEQQLVVIDATGGTFTLTFGGQTTGNIAFNATIGAVETALEALSTIGEANVAVTGTAKNYTVTFQNQLGDLNVAALVSDPALLTGGAGTATVTTPTAGSAGTAGKFSAYNADNTDGSQIPKVILPYDVTTDSGGLVSGPYDLFVGQPSTNAYFSGTFLTSELVNFDGNALTLMGARLVWGTLKTGVVRIP